MDSIAPSLLLRQPTPESSNESTKGDNGSRKRRRPNDPPHEVPPTPGPEATPEERRAARAQRNRIAAQSSRDRRKEEYRYLRDRIAELERENQLLRAGHFVPPSAALTSPAPSSASLDSTPAPVSGSADQWKRDIESENRELRTKVANLERMFALIVPNAPINPLASTSTEASSSSASSCAHSPPSTGGDRLPGGDGPAAGGHQSAIIPNSFPSSSAPNPLALNRASADWLLSLLQLGHPLPVPVPATTAAPVLSSISNKNQRTATAATDLAAVPLASPFREGQDLLADQTTGSPLTAALRATVPEMTFLPTPSTSSYAGSELDFSEFALEPAVSAPEPAATDAASTAIVEEMMSKYLNDMVSDQSWAWEACGHDPDETKDVMNPSNPTITTTTGATEVNVF